MLPKIPERHLPRPASALSMRSAMALTLAATMVLAACGAKNEPAAGGGGPPKMPPAEVGVVTVQPQAVAVQTELPGRVSAVRIAQVRARVNGVVLKRLFREGSDVKAGDPLFLIDAATYQAALDSAQANLGRAQANLSQVTSIAERYKPLVSVNAVSQLDYSNAVSNQKLAEADVASAKAALATSRINLEYATVRAPISGRIGQALVTEGALVSQAEATQMALIQQIGSVYVNFTQSSGDLLRLRKAMASNQLRGAGKDGTTVHIALEDGSDLPRTGRLLFSDLNVDPTSGQVTLRAEVPNPDGLLLPGQYVRVRLAQSELPAAMLLPQQAVTRSNQGDTVLVVGADGVPAKRQIKLGGNQNNQWIVLDGLKPGEQVIVEGFQKMMVPGAPVKAAPWNPAGNTAGISAAPVPASGASAPAPGASAPSAAASK
ncbi:MAG TPA: efflux RND transporter periplasmic adaptor subunit [Burkholderiaceae bacterium]|nr:efflux RND transporter periplasmic adaptor subunit [Burkholderiaceae bacterium]